MLAALALAALCAVTLAGCIGVETTFTFKDDGSGELAVDYRVSQFVTKLGTAKDEEGRVTLPITKADFEKAVADAPGVRIIGTVEQSEDEENITLKARLGFDSVASLAKVRGFDQMKASLARDGSGWLLTQTIAVGGTPDQPIDAQTMELVTALFSGYAVTFVVEAPTVIKSANLGEISGRSVRYSVTIPDLLKMTQKTELEVTW